MMGFFWRLNGLIFSSESFLGYYENKDDETIDENFAIKRLGRWRWILPNGRYTHVNDFR
jgi:hypothetical protein